MTTQSIDAIRYWHRQRNFAMDQRKRTDAALGAFLRTQFGWSLDLPAADRKRIEKQAKDIIKIGEAAAKGKPVDIDEPSYDEWQDVIFASVMARKPWADIEARCEKEMKTLAESLPVWESFGKDVRGFGAKSLAVLVGEAGDLADYPTKGHLWKRMGLAVVGDVRQGGLRKSATKEQWIEHGYSKQRRSRMWNVGESLIKGNGDGKYRGIFLHRHHVECEKAIAEGLIPASIMAETIESWQLRGLPKLTKITAGELKKNPDLYRTAGHINKRAQRYMEKCLLRDLWQAWREAVRCMSEEDNPDDQTEDAPAQQLKAA